MVVIVTFNNAREIHDCLSSLLAATHSLDLAVVVVDNASTDATTSIVGAYAVLEPRVTLLTNRENRGFGAACNQGAATVPSQFVVLLNPDTVTTDGAIDALVAAAATSDSLGPVGGRTVDRSGNVDPRSVQRAPTLGTLFSWAVAVPLLSRRLPLMSRWRTHPDVVDASLLLEQRSVEVVVGCLLCLRREHWELLGGFDERFWLYCEDVDLSLRAIEAGLTPTFTPAAEIMHLWGASSPTFGRKIVYLMRGRATLFQLHWSPVRARIGISLLVAGVGVRALGERVRRRPGAWSDAFSARAEWVGGWPGPEAAGDHRKAKPA